MTAYHSLVTRARAHWKIYRATMHDSTIYNGTEAQRFWRSETRYLMRALRRHRGIVQ